TWDQKPAGCESEMPPRHRGPARAEGEVMTLQPSAARKTWRELAESIAATIVGWILLIAALAWLYTRLPAQLLMFAVLVAILFTLWSINGHLKAIHNQLTKSPET